MASDLQVESSGDEALSAANLVDQICDDFETECLRGKSPDIGAYLRRCDPQQRGTLFGELLALDVEYRRRRGEVPTLSEYVRGYPAYAGVLETIDFNRGLLSEPPTVRKMAIERDEAPERVAHFELLGKLGTGGAGSVWRAWDTKLQRTVAIKLPRFQLSGDDLHRFLREGQTAAQLNHPCIVPVHQVEHEGDVVFIASDFIEGQNLRERLAEGRLKARTAAALCADVAEAIAHAHQHGVVHRDLKPANVMLDAQGKPHVADFGLAKWAEDEHQMTVEGQLLGTPAYMAPEQARGDVAAVDERTDVYAIGVMLYETLTGERPFTAKDLAAVVHAIIHKEPRPPRVVQRKVPRDMETICLKAMEKEPARRYQSAEELADDLRRYLRGDSILARRAGLVERTWRWAKRRPALATSIVLFVIAASAVTIAGTYAEQNRALLGLRPVHITTNPAGATMAFVPLSETTGEPLPDQLVRPRDRSPVSVELKPGDYLVVAALDDGRFHEVYRHVPDPSENLPGGYKHNRWRVDRDGVIQLRDIDIPAASVTSKMAIIEVPEEKNGQSQSAPSEEPQVTHIASFYIDTTEFSVADYQRAFDGALPKDLRWVRRPPSWAVTVSQDLAIAAAEKMGKRLPTAAEFERAASFPHRSSCPADVEESEGPIEFGAVGTPACDRLSTTPAVYGLLSNVAEWTVSTAGTNVPAPLIAQAVSTDYRVVKGGDAQVVGGNPTLSPKHRNGSAEFSVDRYSVLPGLGFRGVRSTRPRLTAADF